MSDIDDEPALDDPLDRLHPAKLHTAQQDQDARENQERLFAKNAQLRLAQQHLQHNSTEHLASHYEGFHQQPWGQLGYEEPHYITDGRERQQLQHDNSRALEFYRQENRPSHQLTLQDQQHPHITDRSEWNRQTMFGSDDVFDFSGMENLNSYDPGHSMTNASQLMPPPALPPTRGPPTFFDQHSPFMRFQSPGYAETIHSASPRDQDQQRDWDHKRPHDDVSPTPPTRRRRIDRPSTPIQGDTCQEPHMPSSSNSTTNAAEEEQIKVTTQPDQPSIDVEEIAAEPARLIPPPPNRLNERHKLFNGEFIDDSQPRPLVPVMRGEQETRAHLIEYKTKQVGGKEAVDSDGMKARVKIYNESHPDDPISYPCDVCKAINKRKNLHQKPACFKTAECENYAHFFCARDMELVRKQESWLREYEDAAKERWPDFDGAAYVYDGVRPTEYPFDKNIPNDIYQLKSDDDSESDTDNASGL